jgi:hypothetical protein
MKNIQATEEAFSPHDRTSNPPRSLRPTNFIIHVVDDIILLFPLCQTIPKKIYLDDAHLSPIANA